MDLRIPAYLGLLLLAFIAVPSQSGPIVFKNLTETSDKENKCTLRGLWENARKTTRIHIYRCENSYITGAYNLKIGDKKTWYRLTGKYVFTNKDPPAMELSMAVSWKNKYYDYRSATGWSGIFYPGMDELFTLWIKTDYVEPKDLWRSSYINHDDFSRVKE